MIEPVLQEQKAKDRVNGNGNGAREPLIEPLEAASAPAAIEEDAVLVAIDECQLQLQLVREAYIRQRNELVITKQQLEAAQKDLASFNELRAVLKRL